MVKKEFTIEPAKRNSELSDVDLIEKLGQGALPSYERDAIRAILDLRAKKVTQDLTEKIGKFNKSTARLNKMLLFYTGLLFAVAFVQLCFGALQIFGVGAAFYTVLALIVVLLVASSWSLGKQLKDL